MKRLTLNVATALLAVIGALSAHAQQVLQSGQIQVQAQGAPVVVPVETGPAVMVLVPTPVASSNDFSNGCWVRFFDDTGFRGANVTLSGPVEIADADLLQGAWRDWDSAVVGPRAQVTVFDNDNFRDRVASLDSNQQVPSLRRDLGRFQAVNSLRLQCK